jgi:hypothetical protein
MDVDSLGTAAAQPELTLEQRALRALMAGDDDEDAGDIGAIPVQDNNRAAPISEEEAFRRDVETRPEEVRPRAEPRAFSSLSADADHIADCSLHSTTMLACRLPPSALRSSRAWVGRRARRPLARGRAWSRPTSRKPDPRSSASVPRSVSSPSSKRARSPRASGRSARRPRFMFRSSRACATPRSPVRPARLALPGRHRAGPRARARRPLGHPPIAHAADRTQESERLSGTIGRHPHGAAMTTATGRARGATTTAPTARPPRRAAMIARARRPCGEKPIAGAARGATTESVGSRVDTEPTSASATTVGSARAATTTAGGAIVTAMTAGAERAGRDRSPSSEQRVAMDLMSTHRPQRVLRLQVKRMTKYIHSHRRQTAATDPRTSHVLPRPFELTAESRPLEPVILVRFDSSRTDDSSSSGFSASSDEAKWAAFLRSCVDICRRGGGRSAAGKQGQNSCAGCSGHKKRQRRRRTIASCSVNSS